MSTRRNNASDESEVYRAEDATAAAASTLRTPTNHESVDDAPGKSRDGNGISMFWRVFGGTILSIIALVGVTLYNNLQSSIFELRIANAKLTEERADLVRKDEFATRMTSNWDRVKTLQNQDNEQNAALRGFRTEMDGLKEKVTRTCSDLDSARKDLNPLDGLKEKVTTLVAESKTCRDDFLKLRQDVDKNHTADQERKANRDSQHKELEKTLKELQASNICCKSSATA